MSGRVVRWSRRRVAGVAALLVLAGAMGAMGVSLACFLYMPVTQRGKGNGISYRDAQAAKPLSVNFEASDFSTGFGVTTRMDYWYWVTAQHSPMAVGLTSCAVGWPMRAFESSDPGFAGAASQAEFARAQTAAMSRPSSSNLPKFLHAHPYRELPTAVLPLGLAVDTLVFAAATGGLWFGFSTARAARRRRAGKCLSCGYPLGALARCPECGRGGCAVALAAFLAVAACSGCRFNGSSLYSELPSPDFERIMREQFRPGMAYAEVEDALQDLRLSHEHGPVPSRNGDTPERGIMARIEPGGPSLGDPWSRARDGLLYLRFAGDHTLDEVAFVPPRERRHDDAGREVLLVTGATP
ncbi:MAG: hypothetical protein IT437_05580 [Phycisphaerales bacterium]|nr:hypothetical protein [Phycisphaerales bacterium]